jgi:hypothetical protein
MNSNSWLNGLICFLVVLSGAGCGAQNVLTPVVSTSNPPSTANLLPLTTLVQNPTATGIVQSASPTPISPQSTPGEPTITLINNRQTVSLQVGQRFLVELGDQYDWEVTSSDPSIVSRVVNIMVVRGAQGVYEAHRSGTTSLTAVGDPPCRKSKPPCEMPSRMFMIQVVVK